jgi:hypothetical protein
MASAGRARGLPLVGSHLIDAQPGRLEHVVVAQRDANLGAAQPFHMHGFPIPCGEGLGGARGLRKNGASAPVCADLREGLTLGDVPEWLGVDHQPIHIKYYRQTTCRWGEWPGARGAEESGGGWRGQVCEGRGQVAVLATNRWMQPPLARETAARLRPF